jgi:hypothetical protein
MKRHILTLALMVALTSFSATSKADNIISLTDSFNYPQGWPNGLQQLYFDGSAFSVAPYSANNSIAHGWNIYNDISMMGGESGLLLWNSSNTFQWVTPGPLAKDTLLGSGAPLGGNNNYFPMYSSSSSAYWGLAYAIGGGNFNYGWVQLSYDASTTTATFLGAAINTTPNQSILVGQVPEPSALSLLAVALGGLATLRRRRP